MTIYTCKNCGINVETSICPVCKKRVESKSTIFWCETCRIPIYSNRCVLCGFDARYLATDVRPVFPEERLLVELILRRPLEFVNDSVWHAGQRYYINGKALTISMKTIKEVRIDDLKKDLDKYRPMNSYSAFDSYVTKFVASNRCHFDDIVSEAYMAIIKSSTGYKKDEMFVSFSGGKDSTVTSDLVMNAFGDQGIHHIFGDTTLEFPETIDYIKRYRETNRKTPILTARNEDKNFYEMCKIVGPPSRVMRWCCIIFKTGAISKKIQSTFSNQTDLLTFYGIRRNESVSRKKYDRDMASPKIAKQRVMSPIIDWSDFDVWLYLLTAGIDFNNAYRYGFSRVGCWCCPNNGEWSQFLTKIYMTDQYMSFRSQLILFAEKIGKPDPEEYIDGGWWKARQGGNGLEIGENVFVEFKPCAIEDKSFNYELNRQITDDLYELFKPFGYLNYDLGNKRLHEIYVLDGKGEVLLKLRANRGASELRVSIEMINFFGTKSIREAEMKIKCQLTKYQMCLGCMACASVCKHNAISIKSAANGQYLYTVNDKLCIRCGDCVNHYDGGCYMRKVIMTKRGE